MAISLKGYKQVSQDLWEQAHKKGAYVWNYDDGLWRKAQYDNPNASDVDSRYVGSNGSPTIFATATQNEFDWALYDAGLLLREPEPLSEGTYQGQRGQQITEEQAAEIDAKRHPELLKDPDWLARHPEQAPASYAEYGMVALGIAAIGFIIYLGYNAFKVKK